MRKTRFEFENAEGKILAGLLEMPHSDSDITSYAVFAHCFTCGKDITAASRISRALAARGIAVLRFDFTGLGNSEGDFANTNFSSNIEDLVAAANALKSQFQAPELFIGHSLGGAAVLSAARTLDYVKAVATIGAPATASHVEHLLQDGIHTIEQEGKATISLGGRSFSIKKQFVDDVAQYQSTGQIRELNASLLIFHSPLDSIVSIDEAADIYQAALHPKSFISLDKADHMLSKAEDSEYVADTLSAWAARYLTSARRGTDRPNQKLAEGEVRVTELDKKFHRGLYSSRHFIQADEPESFGGKAQGPTPYDLLLMSLGACTSMTIRMYANRKQIPLQDIQIQLSHERLHAKDCAALNACIERINRHITFTGSLDEAQKQRLLEIADRCPVHRTLEGKLEITTSTV